MFVFEIFYFITLHLYFYAFDKSSSGDIKLDIAQRNKRN